MTLPSERGKGRVPELPEGLTLAELRFVNPQFYPLDMAMKGWQVFLRFDIGGNPARVSYSLLRSVSPDTDADDLRRQIGMVDEEGGVKPGYYMGIADNPDAASTLSRRLGIEDITDEQGSSMLRRQGEASYLLFNFSGFPTEQTMDIMMALENKFLPEGQKPLTIEDKRSKPKIVFERVRKRLGI